jgi:DnaK suppressor protein
MLTQEQKNRYKKRLAKAQVHLRGEVAHHSTSVGDEPPGLSTHMADDATDVFEQEKEWTLRKTMADELELVETALAKLDTDKFGTCERCDSEIAPARLNVLPHASFCISCQTYMDDRWAQRKKRG